METIILGDGPLGRAIATALVERGEPYTPPLGRPAGGRHAGHIFEGGGVVFDASRGDAVRSNVEAALDGGVRRLVIATTGWDDDRAAVDRSLRAAGAAAVAAPNLSLGAALFLRLIDRAADLFGAVDGFDPYILEWHRRSKRDRPSGTAREIARRMRARYAAEPDVAVIRAGASPGMHLVGFDAPGETIELRLTARDRSAYATGALAAADWLTRTPRSPGIHSFDPVVDELIAPRALAATA
jgi:4-hydroxy-tetrahydrodipicolinate reductase